MAKFIFLVSDGKNIKATYAQPAKLKIKKGCWKERGFSHKIGEAITVYTDGIWIGTLGVYDVSKSSHLTRLVIDTRSHVMALVARKMEGQLYDIFGKKASTNAGCYKLSPRRSEFKLTPKGQLLLKTQEAVNGICFRDE